MKTYIQLRTFIEKVSCAMNRPWGKALLVALPCLLFFIGVLKVTHGYLILGSEGNYITNFQMINTAGSFSWVSALQGGLGFPNPVLNNLRVIFDVFSLLQAAGISFKIINILSIVAFYILPFLSMFWLLCRVMKIRFSRAYAVALFYVVNPFSVTHLQGLMFWNIAPLFILPLIFGCIYKYYLERRKLFLFFGLLSALVSFSLSNIPYLGIFHIFLVLSLILIPGMKHIAWRWKTFVWNIIVLESSFILFNAWWLTSLVRFYLQDIGLYYTKEFAVGWTKYASINGGILAKLSLLTHWVSQVDDNFFGRFYYSPVVLLVLVIPFALIISHLLFRDGDTENPQHKKYALLLMVCIVLVLFLNKGINPPWGGVYIWMMEHIPFFIIFKSPLEKFSPLLVFLFALALVQVVRNTNRKWPYYLLSVYLAVCSIPYITVHFFPEYRFEKGVSPATSKFISKQYIYKEGYFNAQQALNEDKLDYRVLSLPGSVNYQVTMLNHDGNKYYRGFDPFVYGVNKAFITAYFDPYVGFFDSIFNTISNKSVIGPLSVYSVKKIVFNQDIYPAFGVFRENQYLDPPRWVSIKTLAHNYKEKYFDSITVFDNTAFLPHLYIPQSAILTDKSTDHLGEIVSAPNYPIRSAVYFTEQNSSFVNKYIQNELLESKENTSRNQVLEYRKINPIKYRLVIHRAQGIIPLVFSERFHAGWQLYPDEVHASSPIQVPLSQYRILDGNAESQATREEVQGFMKDGVITSLGDGTEKIIPHMRWKNETTQEFAYNEKYTIDFISKNFQGTIQNDNLPSGVFYETLSKKSIRKASTHAMVNGYANSWLLDTQELCNDYGDSVCQKNADGTYDISLVMEFAPQRVFYAGLMISGVGAVATLGYAVYIGLRTIRRRRKV